MTSVVRPRAERGMPSAQKFPRPQDSRVRGPWQHWRRWALGLLALSCSVPGLAADAGDSTPLRRIGVSVTDLGNPFFVRIARSVETAAQRLLGPEVRVSVTSSAYDLQRQQAQIDDFIRKKVGLIILTAVDPIDIETAVRKAQAAGIRVIAVDVRARGADATISTDNVQAGELACAHIAERLHGRGKVVILNGPRVSAITDRVSGCLEKLAQFPGIQVLSSERDGGGSVEGGFSKMTDLLTLHPRIDAVFAINDPTAIGVEQAARQAGRSEFVIVGVDGAPRVKARLKDADSLIVASVAQLPDVQAEKAVEYGLALIRGQPLPKTVELIPAVLLTRDSPQLSSGWVD